MFVSSSERNPLLKAFHAWWVIKTERMPQRIKWNEMHSSYSVGTTLTNSIWTFSRTVDVASVEQLVGDIEELHGGAKIWIFFSSGKNNILRKSSASE